MSHEGNSTTVFKNNAAEFSGGATYILSLYSSITFEGISTTVYNNNTADHCGGLSGVRDTISFIRNSIVVFSDNIASCG